MGLGIYKALGWGIDDVIVDSNDRDNYKVTDPRFDLSSVVFNYENRDQFSDASYLSHITDVMGEATVESIIADSEGLFVSKFMVEEMVKSNVGARRKHLVLDGMIHQPLGDGKSVVLIIPPGNFDKWFHSDSPVDFYESVATGASDNTYAPSVKRLSVAPYPYSGRMNARTGEKIDGPVVRTFFEVTNLLSTAGEDDRKGLSELALAIANKMGFDSVTEALEVIVPIVPGDVKDLAEWTNLFADENAWRDLRPMVLTYWA